MTREDILLDFKELITSPRPKNRAELKALLMRSDPSVIRLCLSLTNAVLSNPILYSMGALDPKPETSSEDLVNVILSKTSTCGDCSNCEKALHLWWNIIRAHALSKAAPKFGFDPLTKNILVVDPVTGSVEGYCPIYDEGVDELLDNGIAASEEALTEWARQDRKTRNWSIQQEKAAMN